jgi:hypothetical protein
MIFRAMFWIGLVAVLMPHEPDLGFGRPAPIDSPLPQAAGWTKATVASVAQDPATLCRFNAAACVTTVTLLDRFRDATVSGLASVKADIAENGSVKLHKFGN